MTDDNAPRWEYQPRGLIIRPGTRWDQWEVLWSGIEQSHKSINFWVGDALNFSQVAFPDTWTQVVDAKYIEQQRGPMWVCSRIPIERRRLGLSFSLHREIAALDPETQDRWLDQAEANGWTVKDLKAALDAEKRRSNGGPPVEEPPPIQPEPAYTEPTDTFGSVEDVTGTPQEAAQRTNGSEVSDIPPTPLRPSSGDAADEIRALIEAVRRLAPGMSPDWLVTDCSLSEGNWRAMLTKGNQVAIGLSPSLPAALIESALASLLSDMGVA